MDQYFVARRARLIFHIVLSVLDNSRVGVMVMGENRSSYMLYRSRWQRYLRRRSAAARLLVLRVRDPPGAWMSVLLILCVLSDRGLSDRSIPRPEESYIMCVCACITGCGKVQQ